MSWFTDVRDAVESVAVVAGNYFLPGSSILTSKLASEGSQEQLNSDLGVLAQLTSGAAGLGLFNSAGVPGSPLFGGGNVAPGTTPAGNAANTSQDAFTSANSTPFSSVNPDVSAYTKPTGIINSTSSQVTQTAKPGVWERMGTFIEKHPVAVGMGIQGAGAVMGGMGAVEQAKIAREKQDYDRQQYERGLMNINAPITLPFKPKPYAPKKSGLINRGMV